MSESLIDLKRAQRLVTAVHDLVMARYLETSMNIVRHAARDMTGADGATFVLKDGTNCYYAEEDAVEPLWKGKRFPLSMCISGWVMTNRTSAVIPDIYKDPRIPTEAYRPTFVRSLAMVPIRKAAPIASIGNYWATNHSATEEELMLLQVFADSTAVTLENVQLYTELEKRVADRTAQLEEANKELEAFSYTVSHDLRAPLRHMNAHIHVIENEATGSFSPKAKEAFQRLGKSAGRMGQIIDDIFRLAQMSSQKPKIKLVNLSELSSRVYESLEHTSRVRPKFLTQPDLLPTCDAALIRIDLENLLGNALKFTRAATEPKIEFGCEKWPLGLAYFMRDNGAGFDFDYADRLFSPFQRLHKTSEFPGSGIGLATVKRIVSKHGGAVRAEGKINAGATIYFGLAKADSIVRMGG